MHLTNMLQRLASVLALVVVPVLSADEPPLLLVGGRVLTQADAGVLPEADVLIVDGKIAAVGPDLDAPENARRIDVQGLTVAPGLIDARSTLWLTAASARQGAADGGLNALDGVDWYGQDWLEVARQGVTAVSIQPASSGNLGGLSAVLRVAPVDELEGLILKSDAAMQAALGMGDRSGTSRDRSSQFERIQAAFTAAQKYQEAWQKWDEYEKKKAEAKEEGKDKEAENDAEKAKRKTRTPRRPDVDEASSEVNSPPADAGVGAAAAALPDAAALRDKAIRQVEAPRPRKRPSPTTPKTKRRTKKNRRSNQIATR